MYFRQENFVICHTGIPVANLVATDTMMAAPMAPGAVGVTPSRKIKASAGYSGTQMVPARMASAMRRISPAARVVTMRRPRC